MPEIELRFAVGPGDLAKLRRALAGMAGGARPRRTTLVSTYFDTPQHALKRQELVLRVRKRGGRYVQTVKAEGSEQGELFARGEWEHAVADGRPDAAALELAQRVAEPIAAEELRPLFGTHVRRTIYALEPRAGTRIEAALDEGEIRAEDGQGAEAIRELELELKAGEPAVLYDVALRLVEVVPLKLLPEPKSERGYRLIAGAEAEPRVFRTVLPLVDAQMTVEAVLQAMGRRCLKAALANIPAILLAEPEGVHQTRTAFRRLRSMLAAVKPMLPAEHYRWANDELRWLGEIVAAPRNWDVFALSLLPPVASAMPQEAMLRALVEGAHERRRAAYAIAVETLASQRYVMAVLRLARWFEALGWRDQPVSEHSALLMAPIAEAAPAILARDLKQARRRTKHFARLSRPERHRFRIALKRLRYTLELLLPILPADASAAVKQLKPLLEELGHANDVRVVVAMLDELRRADDDARLAAAGGLLLGWHERGVADDERRIKKRVRRFRKMKPVW